MAGLLLDGSRGRQTRRRLGGRQPLCGMGVTSEIEPTSRPVACSDRIAVSRPEPGPFTKTSTFFMPCSCACLAADSAASCAANGVDLREPLKPTPPDAPQLITAPVVSVIETIVLLNVDLMWAWPIAMFFFSLRRGLRPAALAFCAALSALSYEVCVAADATCGRPSSCRRRCASDPCACGRWSWSAGRARGGRDGGGCPRRSRSRPCGGCRRRPRGGGRPPPCRCPRCGRGERRAARRSGHGRGRPG